MKPKPFTDRVFACDELPIPLVIHRKKDGSILKFNREAKRILELPESRSIKLNIQQIRFQRLSDGKKHSLKGLVDYGQISHRSAKGNQLLFRVLQKSLKWRGEKCFVDFLYQPDQLASQNFIEHEKERAAKRLQSTLEFSRIGTAELDLASGQLLVDRELYILLEDPGAPQRVSILDFLSKYVVPEDIPIIQNKIKEGTGALSRSDNVVEAEFRMITAKNNELFIVAQGTFTKDGKAFGILRDVTRKRKAEIEARTKNDLLQATLNGITDGFFLTDKNLNFVIVNSAFANKSKMQSHEMVGKNMLTLFPHMKDSEITKAYRKAIETGVPDALEYKSRFHENTVYQINVYPNSQGLLVYYKDVSLSAKSQEARVELLHRLEKISQNLPGFIYQYRVRADGSSHFPYASLGIKKIYGVSPEEVERDASKVFSVLHPDDFEQVKKSIFKSKEKMSQWSDRYRVKLSDSKTIWVEGHATPEREADGSILWHGYISDVTERMHAEQALNQSEERFRALYNRTPAMMHSIDQEGKLMRVSDYWLAKMEYAREEVIGKLSTDFLTPQSKQKVLTKIIPDLFTTGLIVNVDYQFKTKSGKILDTLLSATCERDEQGKIVKSMAVITDVTLEKSLEREIAKLAMIASRTGNAVILMDAACTVTWVNEGFEKILGYRLTEVIGKKFLNLHRTSDTDPTALKWLEEGVSETKEVRTELACFKKNGDRLWLDIELLPIFNDQNQLTGFIANEADITSLKLAISEMLNSQSQLQTMMDNAPLMVYIKDMKGRYLFYNEAYKKIAGGKLPSAHTDLHVWGKEKAEFYYQKDQEAITLNRPIVFEHTLKGRQYMETKFKIQNYENKIQSIGSIAIDVTERNNMGLQIMKQADELKNQHDLLTAISENLPSVAIYQYEVEPNHVTGHYKYYSTGVELITGLSSEQLLSNPQLFEKRINPEDYQKKQGLIKRAVSNLSVLDQEYRFQHMNGEWKWLRTRTQPTLSRNGKITWTGLIIDITDQKLTEALIKERESRLRSIIETEPNCIKVLDQKGRLLEMNSAGLKMIEANSFEEISNVEVLNLVDNPFKPAFAELTKNAVNGSSGKLEFSITGLKGSKRWLETLAVPLRDEVKGNNNVLGITRDITDQKTFQDQLLASLKEKEVLIKEIHHRVKNNLQLISSILYIKMITLKESGIKNFLNETRQKIRSIALVHERLLQSGAMNEIEISEYLGKLVKDLLMARTKQGIDIVYNFHPKRIALDTAIYCGLIINELVTNSMKHAFVSREYGKIEVNFSVSEQGSCLLKVSDDGNSLPPNIKPGAEGSFGMQLLDIFVKQIKGNCKIDRTNGTVFLIQF